MKALLAVDGSDASWEAIRLAGLTLSSADEVGIYYAPPALQFPRGAKPPQDVVERSRKALAEAVIAEAVNRLPSALTGQAQRFIGEQNPQHGILICADQWRADIIMMGARGTGTIKSLVLGSVSRAVVHHATVPVLVARARPPQPSDAEFNVLVGFSTAEETRPTLDLINRLHWSDRTRGRLIHVMQPMFVGQLPPWLEKMARDSATEPLAQAWVREHDEAKQHTAVELAAVAQQLPEPFRKLPPIVAEGYASEQILHAIDEHHVDLCVVGARGVAAWERFLVGSTSEKVLAGAHCSVLVVRRHTPS